MTVGKKDTINIPKAWVLVILPLIVGIIGGSLSSSYNIGKIEGKYKTQIEVNTKRLDVVETNKVDRAQFDLIDKSLFRIEGKLDQHLSQPTKPVLVR